MSWFSEKTLVNRFGPDKAEQATQGKLPKKIREEFAPALLALQSRLEVLAAVWALDQVIPLKVQAPDNSLPFLTVFYENLVRRPKQEIDRITDYLDIPTNQKMYDQLGVPSSSVWTDEKVLEAQNQLSKWKDKLSKSQQDTILMVINDFGLDFLYDDDILPKTDQIK